MQQMVLVAEGLMMAGKGLFDATQTQLHGMAAQALERHDTCMPLSEQVITGEVTHTLMVRAHAVEAHMAVTAVDQNTGFAHFSSELMNMRIVDTDQKGSFCQRIAHFGDKQRSIRNLLFHRTITDPDFMVGGRRQNALDHLVVKNIAAYVKGPCRSENHQIIEHQPAGRQTTQDPL